MRRTRELPITPITQLVDDHHIADRFGISRDTLQSARVGRGELADLPWYKIGRACRYDPIEVMAWLAAHRIGKVV